MTRSRSSFTSVLLGFFLITGTARADDLDSLRERFKVGMAQYNRGAFTDAIATWEAIYAELGPEKGYRLAFNIASAYDQLAATHAGSAAAEIESDKAGRLFQAYVNETTRRREAGETLEPLIEKQEEEAKQHLGRIRIEGEPSVIVRLDEESTNRHAASVVWVVRGTHTITFHPGQPEQQKQLATVEVGKELVVRFVPAARAQPPVIDAPPSPPTQDRFVTREERPFDKTWLFVGAGATLASTVIPLIFYANAWSIEDEYRQEQSATPRSRDLADEYTSARRIAYATLAIPAILGAATAGLTAYWLLGTRETKVPLTVTGAISPAGSGFTATARF